MFEMGLWVSLEDACRPIFCCKCRKRATFENIYVNYSIFASTMFEFSPIIFLLCCNLLSEKGVISMDQKYLSLKETSKKWGISDRRINTLCLAGRIPGAFKVGNSWVISADAERNGRNYGLSDIGSFAASK